MRVPAKTRQNTPNFSIAALSFNIGDNVFHLFARNVLGPAPGSGSGARCSGTQFQRAGCSGHG
jgi:hypothetical protein